MLHTAEEILKRLSYPIDFIAGNDDTHSAVTKYEKNNEDVESFGLFVTRQTIPNLKAYYSSPICNAYVNLTHVSFGLYPSLLNCTNRIKEE